MVVEPEVERAAVVLRHPQAPLADDRRRITSLFQSLRDRDRPGFHGMLTFDVRPSPHVVTDRCVAKVFAGHQGTATWRANRTAAVEVREPHTFGGDAVDTWRLDLSLPIAAKIAIAEVIGL